MSLALTLTWILGFTLGVRELPVIFKCLALNLGIHGQRRLHDIQGLNGGLVPGSNDSLHRMGMKSAEK